MATERSGCLGLLFGLFRSAPPAAGPEALPYGLRDDFLSPAELSFYRVLRDALGAEYAVCPKVNLADLVFVRRPNENAGARNRIDRKHVDFVLCRPDTLRPVAAVELDDASHQRADRQERDAFVDQVLAAAGLPVVRVPARRAYAPGDVRELIRQAIGAAPPVAEDVPTPRADGVPVCPKCQEPMVRRTARRGTNEGADFFGCVNFPHCKEVAPA